MKRLLIILSLVLITVSVQCQLIGRYPMQKRAVAASLVDSASWEAEYKTVYYEMTTPPSLEISDHQNTLVKSLVDDGYWARMDVLYILAQYSNTNSEALLNWKAPGTYNATLDGTPVFTSLEGFTTSSSNYLITNYHPATEGVNYTLNSATFGVYSRTADQSAGYDLGNDGDANDIALRWTDDASYAHINGTGRVEGSVTSGAGFCAVTRRGANDIELYGRGASIASDTDVSVAIPAYPFYIGTRLPATGVYSPRQFSLFFAMDGISDAENIALSTIFETYMDAIGKGVQ